MARPSKYKPEYCEQGRKLALLGATDIQVADFLSKSHVAQQLLGCK